MNLEQFIGTFTLECAITYGLRFHTDYFDEADGEYLRCIFETEKYHVALIPFDNFLHVMAVADNKDCDQGTIDWHNEIDDQLAEVFLKLNDMDFGFYVQYEFRQATHSAS